MAFRIASSIVPMQAGRFLNRAQQTIDKSLSSLASGSRIVKAGDDAAGFAISESLRAQHAGTKQAKFNAEAAIGMIQTAEGGLNEQNNILVRLRELAVYSASDTVGEEEREFLNDEFTQLVAEFDRIAKTTRYGNKQMLTGSGENFEFQVGAYKGEDNVIKFRLDANTTASNLDIDDLEIADQDDALDALEYIDDAMSKVAGTRASFGAMQSRLQYAINALEVQGENLDTARAHIVDVDMADEVAKLAQAQLVQEAAISVVAQSNLSSRRAMRLLET